MDILHNTECKFIVLTRRPFDKQEENPYQKFRKYFLQFHQHFLNLKINKIQQSW